MKKKKINSDWGAIDQNSLGWDSAQKRCAGNTTKNILFWNQIPKNAPYFVKKARERSLKVSLTYFAHNLIPYALILSWFSEFPSLINYLGIKFQYTKNFKKIIKRKCFFVWKIQFWYSQAGLRFSVQLGSNSYFFYRIKWWSVKDRG